MDNKITYLPALQRRRVDLGQFFFRTTHLLELQHEVRHNQRMLLLLPLNRFPQLEEQPDTELQKLVKGCGRGGDMLHGGDLPNEVLCREWFPDYKMKRDKNTNG